MTEEEPGEEPEEEPADEEPAEETDESETGEIAEEPEIKKSETEEPEAEEPVEKEPAEEETAEEPAEEEPATEEPAEEPAVDPDQEMLDNGYVQVMVIRENGTNLYNTTDADAEAAGALNHGDVIWIKAAGGMWGEVYQEETENSPLYFNLNNVVLLKGEVEYSIPIRKVRLTSTLDGLTEIREGTEIVITAEFSGFTEDEIADITWQYRAEDEEENIFHDIEEAHGFVYTYLVSAENVHNEWRIILTLKA